MLSIELEKREATGKALKDHREGGKLPVVVYGAGKDAEHYFVDQIAFEKLWREAGESTMVNLMLGGKGVESLINDVQVEPLSQKPIHADFYIVDVNKPVEVSVPLEFEGVSPAVKNLGGVLVKVLHEVEISVLPKELPHNLVIDLTKITELDGKITAAEIELPASASLITSPEETVALVEEPKEEVEEEVRSIDDIEVEDKGKKEEEGAAEGGEGEKKE